jgi:hypothetical protein
MPPLVPERQVELWTSSQILAFFKNAGITCRSFPILGRVEDLIPADFVFGGGDLTKVFGLQYKALYSGPQLHWPLDSIQHRNLKAYSWIYYGLSELSDVREADNALHALWIAHPSFRYRKRLAHPTYSIPAPHGPWLNGSRPELFRWYDFFLGLRQCYTGVEIEDQADFINLFVPVWGFDDALREASRISDYFAINFERREALRFTTIPQ